MVGNAAGRDLHRIDCALLGGPLRAVCDVSVSICGSYALRLLGLPVRSAAASPLEGCNGSKRTAQLLRTTRRWISCPTKARLDDTDVTNHVFFITRRPLGVVATGASGRTARAVNGRTSQRQRRLAQRLRFFRCPEDERAMALTEGRPLFWTNDCAEG